ncbi:hypothetical protein CGLAUT_06575 [Corynebacterium glaucum]|nr:hypothetical protein CGLAUT_06575 [Corynebacterium glaucum]
MTVCRGGEIWRLQRFPQVATLVSDGPKWSGESQTNHYYRYDEE